MLRDASDYRSKDLGDFGIKEIEFFQLHSGINRCELLDLSAPLPQLFS